MIGSRPVFYCKGSKVSQLRNSSLIARAQLFRKFGLQIHAGFVVCQYGERLSKQQVAPMVECIYYPTGAPAAGARADSSCDAPAVY
eukprot:scaffold753_cov390-Pavlova_lutheri.AAC.20